MHPQPTIIPIMDLNSFLQETANTSGDNPDATEAPEWMEFQSLARLASEFTLLDRSLFPFSDLKNSDLRSEIYGFSPSAMFADGRLVRGALVSFSSMFANVTRAGNYVAGYILRDLRIQSRKNTQIYPELCFIFDLPPELVFEVRHGH